MAFQDSLWHLKKLEMYLMWLENESGKLNQEHSENSGILRALNTWKTIIKLNAIAFLDFIKTSFCRYPNCASTEALCSFYWHFNKCQIWHLFSQYGLKYVGNIILHGWLSIVNLRLTITEFFDSDCPLSDILLEKLWYAIILTRKLCLQSVMYIADADTVTLQFLTVYYKEYLLTTPFLASTYR